MKPFAMLMLATSLCLVVALGPKQIAHAQLQPGWSAQQLQQLLQIQQAPNVNQFGAPVAQLAANPALSAAQTQRQLIAPDLQNQVQALNAQLAAANRQIQFYQQQLAGQQQSASAGPAVPQQQQSLDQLQPLNQPPVNTQMHQQQQQQQQQLQQQLQQQQQLQAAIAAQQQQLSVQQQQQSEFSPSFGGTQQAGTGQQQQTAQFPSAQPQFQPTQSQLQQQPQTSTLIDNSATAQLASDPRLAGQPQFFPSNQQQPPTASRQTASQFSAQQQPQQPQQPQPTTSSSVEAASIEPSLVAQQQQPAALQHPTVHQSASKSEEKFSIGLGVLSPGYTQKFGQTTLDFDQNKDGFSYTLSNNGHSNQPPPTPTQKPAV